MRRNKAVRFICRAVCLAAAVLSLVCTVPACSGYAEGNTSSSTEIKRIEIQARRIKNTPVKFAFKEKYGRQLSIISICIFAFLVVIQLIIRKFESHREHRWLTQRANNLSNELMIEKTASGILREHIMFLTSNTARDADEPSIFELKDMIDILTKPYASVFRNKHIGFKYSFADLEHNRLIGIRQELERALQCILSDAMHSACNAEADDKLDMSVRLDITEKPVNNSNTFVKFEFSRNFGLYEKNVGDIVQKYMKLLNGTIETKSKDDAVITSITVPFEIAPDTATAAFVHEPEKGYDFSGKTALIAENNELNLAIMSELLKDVGFKTICVRNGQQAVYTFNKAMNNDIDIIIMDADMPIMDAYTAAHTIRKSMHANHDTVPIIITLSNTHISRQFDEDRRIKSGITAGVSSSMNTDELYFAIDNCFSEKTETENPQA